jgi:hypothetical protein
MYFYQVIDNQNAQTEQKSEYIYLNGRKVTEAAMDKRSCCDQGRLNYLNWSMMVLGDRQPQSRTA